MILNYSNYLNLLIFFLAYLYIFFSITGYGIIFYKYLFSNKLNYRNNFIFFFFGLPFVFLIIFYYSIFFKYNFYFNIFFTLTGLFFFLFFCRNKFFTIFLLIIFFSGLLISRTHDDFGAYHYQYLKELMEGKPTLGIANLATRYYYASSLTYIQGIFYLPFFNLNLFFIPIYLIYISLVCYLLIEIKNSKNINNTYIFLVILSVILLKFSRFREHGYDYLVHFLIFFLFCTFIKKNIIDIFIVLIFFLLIILNKFTAVIFFPLILYFFNFKTIVSNFFFRKFLVILLLILSIFLNSFIKTGCIHYVSKFTCPDLGVDWMVFYDETINVDKQFALNWARGLYHGNKDIILQNDTLFSLSWINNWMTVHFKNKLLDFIILVFSLLFLLLFSVFKVRLKINFKLHKIFILSFFCLILWFFLIPSVRFAYSIIVLFLISFFLFFFELEKIRKKILYSVIILLIFYFNNKNINRIYDEFSTTGFYKFDNFPYFKIPERNFNSINIESSLEYYMPVDLSPDGSGKTCWNVQTPCKEDLALQGRKNRDIYIKEYKFFRVISLKK